MARKKIPSMEEALNIFKDVMTRASLKNYVYVNNIMISKNPKDQSVLIIPDQELWKVIMEDAELSKDIRALNPENPDDSHNIQISSYAEDLNEGWFDIDLQVMYVGSLFRIKVDGLEYRIPINKSLIPLKLRKAEYNNISYRVFLSPDKVLAVKKKFDYPILGCGFTVMRILQIL